MDTRCTIYKKTDEVYQLKLKASRMFYSEVNIAGLIILPRIFDFVNVNCFNKQCSGNIKSDVFEPMYFLVYWYRTLPHFNLLPI